MDNLAENEIRPITLGRKYYLFCGNHDINPRLYLNSVIATMPYFEKASEEELLVLLPHRWKEFHPEAIMTTPVRQLTK
ncbi:MAG: hypothetical protein K2L45_10895 [Muribaculaceae bacterium]|nr:hypothetical protein [Muribaculaceae bacterium]